MFRVYVFIIAPKQPKNLSPNRNLLKLWYIHTQAIHTVELLSNQEEQRTETHKNWVQMKGIIMSEWLGSRDM